MQLRDLCLAGLSILVACRGGLVVDDASKGDASTAALPAPSASSDASPGTGGTCASACLSVHSLPPLTTFSSGPQADAALTGDWTVCPDSTPLEGFTFAHYGASPSPPLSLPDFPLGTSDDGSHLEFQSQSLTDPSGAGLYTVQYGACPEVLLLTSMNDPSKTVVLARGRAPASPAPHEGCSILGTFDSTAHWDGQLASFQFSADGTFIGGMPGANLPADAIFSGAFVASSDEFDVLGTKGMKCDGPAASPLVWDSTCAHVSMTTHYDECTGGRLYLGGGTQTDLTRR